MKLTLFHYWRSSCSWRVRWALALKGVTYENAAINLLQGEQSSANYLARNPAGFVPALNINGAFYGESMAIIEWIDETWKDPPLLPKEPLRRLRARQLALTVVAGIQPLQNLSALKFTAADEAQRQRQAQHFISKGLKTYETLLGLEPQGIYSMGDAISLPDLCLVPQVYNALRFNVDLAPTPRVKAIYERCLTTPACAASHPTAFSPPPGAP